MTKLITLNGNSTQEPFSNIQNLSDTAAGLIFWKQVLELDPNITWRDIMHSQERLSGLFSNLWRKTKNAVGDVVGGTGKIISNVGDKMGDWGGSAIRLATDEKVQDGVSRGIMAYASGGGSEAAKSMLSSFGSKTKNPVSEAGKQYKTMLASANFGGIDPKYIMVGGVVIGLVGLAALFGGRK